MMLMAAVSAVIAKAGVSNGLFMAKGPSGGLTNEDAARLQRRGGRGLLRGRDAGGPHHGARGDDRVADEQQPVIALREARVAGGEQDARGVLAAIGGRRVE